MSTMTLTFHPDGIVSLFWGALLKGIITTTGSTTKDIATRSISAALTRN